MNRWRFFLPLAVFALFLGVAGYQLTQPKSEFVESTMIGKTMTTWTSRMKMALNMQLEMKFTLLARMV